jgi:hypothetical protein
MSAGSEYYNLDSEKLKEVYTFTVQKHYPHRIPPREWPSKELMGKAVARGWAIPCRYYPFYRGRGRFYQTFVYPGITDREMMAMRIIMRKENTC